MEHEENYWDRAARSRLSRRQLLKTGAAAGFGLAAGLSILGCNSSQTQQAAPAKSGQTPQSQSGQPKTGGVLKIGYQAGNGYLNPGATRAGWDLNFVMVLGDSLVYANPDGSPNQQSSLASSWTREGDTVFNFKLREGIKFHDGTDYDAAAQKYNFEYLLDANRSKTFGYRGMIETIKTMTVVDKYTLRVELSRKDPAFLANLGGHPGVPVSPTAIDKLGPDITTKPACTGPYSVKSFTPGGEWVFEKNPNYWQKGLPYLDGITFVEIPDDRVRAAAIQAGEVDVAWFATAGEITASLKKDSNLVASDGPSGPSILVLHHAMPPLDNLQIRQAIAHCIDREAILKTVFSGNGQAAKGGLIPPGNWAYTDCSDVMYNFDINKARDLIKESGIKPPIPLKLVTTDTPSDRKPQGELIKGWLDDAGFQVTLEIYPEQEMYRRGYDEASYHLIVNSVPNRVDPDGIFSTYTTTTAYWAPGRSSQDPMWVKISDLTKAAAGTYDQAERKKAYDELQRLQAQQVMAQQPLVYRVYVEAHRKNVKENSEKIWSTATSTLRLRFLSKE